MITKLNTKTWVYLSFFISLIALNSCTTAKKLKYFQDLPESSQLREIGKAEYTDPIIQADDILSINVNTTEAEVGQVINARNLNAGTNAVGAGYLVDKAGFVEVPILGKVHVGGLTTAAAKEAVRAVAKKNIKDPIVDVRFANFKVTVLGEVNRPASYFLPNERVTILDAIGYAGDMTIYGKRNNVLIMRKDTEGKNYTVTVDMTKKDIINSPNFYLKQNDVVYVEPRKSRQDTNTENSIARYITVAATVLTALVLLNRYGL